ncbi:MFS transporter [Candidatus Bathyarchaeota archaeon]|nr:MFS transporter [Candidatus Bathyarchaeota archaeon]
MKSSQSRSSLFPLHLASFLGDLLLSLMIVASVLVGTTLGLPGWQVGLLASAYGSSYLFAAIFMGYLSDKIGSKASMILATSGISATGVLMFLFPTNFFLIFIGELVVGILNGFYWPSIEALTSQLSIGDAHRSGISKFCISWSLGYMLGPFLAPVLDDVFPAISFLLVSVISGINLLIATIFLPTEKIDHALKVEVYDHPTHSCVINHPYAPISGKTNGRMDKMLFTTSVVYILLAATYSFTKGFVVGIFPDIAKGEEFRGWGGMQTGVILAVFGMARTLAFVIHGRTKQENYRLTVIYSALLPASMMLLVISREYWYTMIVLAITGFLTGLVYGNALDSLMKVNQEAKGFVAGWFESTMGIGAFASAMIGGISLDAGGELLAYISIGLITLSLAVASSLLKTCSMKWAK